MTPALFAVARRVAEGIMDTLKHYPYGYTFLVHLPHAGRHNRRALKAKIVREILTATYPRSVIHLLLSAALLPSGAPNPTAPHLYNWVLHTIYSNNVQAMYKEWLTMPQHLKEKA